MPTMHPEPPFWLVWNENGLAPRFKHDSPEAAEREATRLANEKPGTSFCVLCVTARITKRSIEIERFDPDSYVPF